MCIFNTSQGFKTLPGPSVLHSREELLAELDRRPPAIELHTEICLCPGSGFQWVQHSLAILLAKDKIAKLVTRGWLTLTHLGYVFFACFRRTWNLPSCPDHLNSSGRRDRSFYKSFTKHVHKVPPQSHKGTNVLEDLSSLSSNQSSFFSCSSVSL